MNNIIHTQNQALGAAGICYPNQRCSHGSTKRYVPGVLQGKVKGKVLSFEQIDLPSYKTGFIQNVGKEEFELLLGYPAPSGCWNGELGPNVLYEKRTCKAGL